MLCPKCDSSDIKGSATILAVVNSDNWVNTCNSCGTKWTTWQQEEIERLKRKLRLSDDTLSRIEFPDTTGQ